MDDQTQGDICRVCRCEGQADRPLFHPCICTGSIKWIHQECLMQWMRYSRKEYCELCGHRFSFTPIYSPDMPRVLPLRDVAGGLLTSISTAVRYWLHYTLVALAWLGLVPLTAYRTYKLLFSGSFDYVLSFPLDILTTDNIAPDLFRGCFVVTCTLFAFIGLVWLREQILHGGGPDWLERDDPAPVQNVANNAAAEAAAPPPAAGAAAAAAGDHPGDVAAAAEEVIAENNNNNINNNNNNNNNEAAAADAQADGIGAAEVGQNVNEAAVENDAEPLLQARVPRLPVDLQQIDPAEPPAADAEEPRREPDVAADEGNWNPMEWDRAAEELTWERLLGLDGSMVFLEHVFWVISINTIFIFIFAFCPFSIGNFVITFLGLIKPGKPLMHFHGLLTTLVGYCVIGITLLELHAVAKFFKLRRPRKILGLCYIVVKVSLLSVVEIGVLPLICGWWLDICSLPVFDATLKDRKQSFKAAPGTSLFIHWMFGMVYVYYFASFTVLLREVLRPGVLWFVRNLNDPDFSPIQEMIHLSILRHTRRLIASTIIFGSAVLLMLWLPIQTLKTLWPTFLPYTLSGDSEVNELSLQLLLLQIILPGFFEQSHTRIWLKGIIRLWCTVVSWFLGIRSYLLGSDQPQNDEEPQPRPQPEHGQGLGAAHQALLQRENVRQEFQPYEKPSLFAIRLIGLVILMCISLAIGSLITLTIPVWIGRHGMSLWSVGSHINHITHSSSHEDGDVAGGTEGDGTAGDGGGGGGGGGGVGVGITPATRPHELYTAALGIYLCWILSRGISIAVNLFPQGRAAVIEKLKHWVNVAASYAMAAIIFVLLLGVVPLLFGLLLELVVVVPLRVPLEQTPILFLWQDWALGVLYTKIACALTLMGPDWALKRAIDRAYRDGIRDIDLKFIIRELAIPVITCFGLALAVPYVIAHSIMPIFFANEWTRIIIVRRIYPFFLVVAVVIAIVIFQIRQFKKLYVAIKNDKYLVGQRLVNYDHRKKKQESPITTTSPLVN